MRSLLVACLLISSLARSVASAAEPPPTTTPDVLHGERYDGRKAPPEVRKNALVVPRLFLAVPRLVMRGIGRAAKPLMEWNERKHIAERVVGALTSDDGLVGVRPVINYELAFRPSFGVLYFNDRLPGGGHLMVSSAMAGPETILQNGHVTV